MDRNYILEKLTEELLQKINNGENPYKTVKGTLNMALDIGANHLKFSQTNQPKRKLVIQMSMLGNFIDEFVSVREASRITGVDKGNISHCCLGKVASAGGFKWKYKNKN